MLNHDRMAWMRSKKKLKQALALKPLKVKQLLFSTRLYCWGAGMCLCMWAKLL